MGNSKIFIIKWVKNTSFKISGYKLCVQCDIRIHEENTFRNDGVDAKAMTEKL